MQTEQTAAERAAFKERFPCVDHTMDKDAWGRPVHAHPAVGALWDGWQARAALATKPAGAEGAPKQRITIDFKQVTELLEMFGGEPGEIVLDVGQGHSGAGLYAWYSELPEEGAEYLGVANDEAAPPPAQAADSTEPVAFSNWVWRHKKSGGEYTLLGDAKLQTDQPLTDMAEVYVYQGDDHRMWIRPVAEFNERFKRVHPIAAEAVPPASCAPAVRKIQRFNNRAGLMNPESNGLYVRYEDHCEVAASNAAEPPASSAPADLTDDEILACNKGPVCGVYLTGPSWNKIKFGRAVIAAYRLRASNAAEPAGGEVPDFTPPSVPKHERGMTAREVAILDACVSNMDDLDDKDWRDHGFRRATFDSMKSKLSALTSGVPPQAPAVPAGLSDAQRLDYLQNRGATVEIWPNGAGWSFRVGGLHSAVHSDIRLAIDAALAASAPAAKGEK